ncbi:amidohydrolase family protein [Methylonatrum kenyense]|uniref:amidohydrolase family protein n=1 Tax=Methylonatrum kenyense TaxID=455253 RepID=UPI0020C0D111|nr:amidohydrolase family protein [Methylonatrum kenyense]MCK8515352.1 amidohydrolase family protein [Methylonatrum kenyense]
MACFRLFLPGTLLGLLLAGHGAMASAPTAWVGGAVWLGKEQGYLEDAVLLVGDGRVVDVFSRGERPLPEDATVHDVSGQYIVPGLINAHGHVGMARGLETGPEIHSRDNVIEQLQLYAAYGITTVVSLGDEPPEAFAVRDGMDPADSSMARLFVAGTVPNPVDAEAAREAVRELRATDPDWLKIRVDDQLGQAEAMPREAYSAFIDEAHGHGDAVATHMVTLEHAKGLLEEGADLIAHSVRDAPVDDELIRLMLERDVCITPTLTREVSTFIYAERPDFFDDPFFLRHADPDVLEQLQEPEVQARFTGDAADYYRAALPLAMSNMLALHAAGVRIAMGTDSGPPARFQGYFEHMEMAMMQEAGMSPADILESATRHAADCLGVGKELGTLEPGKWADFILLSEDPSENIRALRTLKTVVLAGRDAAPQ